MRKRWLPLAAIPVAAGAYLLMDQPSEPVSLTVPPIIVEGEVLIMVEAFGDFEHPNEYLDVWLNDTLYAGRLFDDQGTHCLAQTQSLRVCAWDYNQLALPITIRLQPSPTVDPDDCASYAHITIQYKICPDFDGDGQVAMPDLLALIAAWGICSDCPEDVDRDGTVGQADLLKILASWGPCAEPCAVET